MKRKIFTEKWQLEYQNEERKRIKKHNAEYRELVNPMPKFQYDELKKYYDNKRKKAIEDASEKAET